MSLTLSTIRMMALRPSDAHIAATDHNASELFRVAVEIGVLCLMQDLEPLTNEQMSALWCADLADTWGMFESLAERCGLDEERMQEAVDRVLNLLSETDQKTLVEMEAWGII